MPVRLVFNYFQPVIIYKKSLKSASAHVTRETSEKLHIKTCSPAVNCSAQKLEARKHFMHHNIYD